MSELDAKLELPRYQCHKQVWALKIKMVTFDRTDNGWCRWQMIPEEEGYAPINLSEDFVQKHSPKVGGYYVQYPDGYVSYSPAEAFESGYTRIP